MFTLTIRSKVLLLSLTLFSIPYVGYEYVREMEKYLRDNLETSLMDTARAIASVLNDRPSLFSRNLADTVRDDSALMTYSLKTPIRLDGKLDDWQEYLDKARVYGEKDILRDQGNYTQESLSFKHLIAKYRGYLYALFIVTDDMIIYRDSTSLYPDRNDHVQIVMKEPDGQVYRYIIAPNVPGWVSAYKVQSYTKSFPPQLETRIQGVWEAIKDGYLLELRIPLNMVGEKLGFAIADVDNPNRRDVKTLMGTSAIHNIDTVGNIFIPSPEIEQIIRSLGHTPGRRVWVVDKQRRVLAQHGDLHREFPYHPLNFLYSLLLPPVSENFKDEQAYAFRLEGEQVVYTLNGDESVRWRSTSDERAVIVSAAHPVLVNNQVQGAVIVEETSNNIQTVQRQAIANLFNKTLIIFGVVTLLLLAFANHISVRLRRLRNQAETAIDMNGRVRTTVIGSSTNDEIGDLSHSFSTILEKLQQYNTYLESMASRLSHELRTPIAVVRSSLENLEQESLPEESLIYIERAKDGINRLNTIFTRLSEATRLEQALQTAERELFNLTKLVTSCLEGYRLAYPRQQFKAEIGARSIVLDGAPDLIAQMLDKLIANAVDFAEPNTPIIIQLSQEKQTIRLSVSNQGASLPTGMTERLFESMVSLRSQSVPQKEPHLGLGLYIVRLIVGYHGGQVKALNITQPPGAIFTALLPTRFSEIGI